MIEIEGNRLYVKGLFVCYAAHTLPDPVAGDCCIMWSHLHQRNLISCAGRAWMGSNDGAIPHPDILIGHVVGIDGLIPDPGAMDQLMNIIQAREDIGLKTRIVING